MSKVKTNVVEQQVEQQVEEQVVVTDKSFKDICNEIVANGGNRVKGLKVRSVKVTEQENYVMVSLSIDRKIKGYVANEDTGIFEEGMTAVVFSSTYSLASIMKNDEDMAFAANHLVENPKGFEVVLSGATIDIIQQPVTGDELYKNPFSTRDVEGVAFGHDTIINHIVNIVLSKRGSLALDAIATKLLGF